MNTKKMIRNILALKLISLSCMILMINSCVMSNLIFNNGNGPPINVDTNHPHVNSILGKKYVTREGFYIRLNRDFNAYLAGSNKKRRFGDKDVWIPIGTKVKVIGLKYQATWAGSNYYEEFQILSGKAVLPGMRFFGIHYRDRFDEIK